MEFQYFEIENFKGIEKIKIDLSQSPKTNIYTLVGLNESGKTTILDAINFFAYNKDKLDPLDLQGYKIPDIYDLIPINKRDNFNGDIIIRVGLSFNDEDEKAIRAYMKEKFNYNLKELSKTLVITQKYPFKDSNYDENNKGFYWDIAFHGKKQNENSYKKLNDDSPEWEQTTDSIITFIPSILYFPNFLFEFPDKIFLEDHPDQNNSLFRFYRTVLQDILNSLGSDTNIETHILARAKSNDENDRTSLESLLLKMSANVTNKIFDYWNKIFDRKIENQQISITCNFDHNDVERRYYLKFKIIEGDQQYSIKERSLGFRWFFVFFLLTTYRRFRIANNKKILFLFDEPASNLHQAAQQQLLHSLERLALESKIIYTTHSHHLINPLFLEGAYVVRNEGLDYSGPYEKYSARSTKIEIERYRTYAVSHPNQTTYFQPILDVLKYKPSSLEYNHKLVIVEGKYDYYILNYFQSIIMENKYSLAFIPGTGSGSQGDIIKIFIGWSQDFIILLDADNEGVKQKNRYIKLLGNILDNKIHTLADINSDWAKKEIEDLIDKNEKLSFQQVYYKESTKYGKDLFNRGIQEALTLKNTFEFQKSTLKNFDHLLNRLSQLMAEQQIKS
jgi:predicted ATP-dependent endonuclease of OLD family